jgi:hypothetical protein
MQKLISSSIFLSIILVSLFTNNNVQAQETIFSDDFSGTMAKWQPTRDDARYWSIQDQSLQALVPFGSTITELIPNSSSVKNLRNFTYDFDFTALGGADKNISFGVVDKNNWYEVHFTPSITEIVKVANGQVVWNQHYPYILNNAVTYHISIVFKDGLLLLFINNTKVFETTDPTFQSHRGTIGVKASTGGVFPTHIKVDNIVVKNIAEDVENHDTLLGVRLLKQTDSAWASFEYDSANTWSPALGISSTIEEWGCNLLAQIMILHYHGITTFANNTPISPQSLNTWLLENSGFYDSPKTGNINKQSISLLTAEISKKKGTPKLEFTYIKDNLIETAIAEITKGNPVILELDGHFVVADGFTADKKDLYIKDPAYDITKLSDHPLALKSVRLYTPSQTDLSYITVVSGNDLTVDFAQNNSQVTNSSTYIEKLRPMTSSTTPTFGPLTKITEIAKPSADTYTVTITNPTSSKQAVDVVSYPTNGTPQKLLSAKLDPGTSQFQLNYSKDGSSALISRQQQSSNFKKLKSTVKLLRDTNQIKQAYFAKALLQLLRSADDYSSSTQLKLLKVVKVILTNAPQALITKSSKALLLDQVQLLMVSIRK